MSFSGEDDGYGSVLRHSNSSRLSRMSFSGEDDGHGGVLRHNNSSRLSRMSFSGGDRPMMTFTGGFNSVTHANLMDKVIDSEASHPQMAGSSCAAVNDKLMSDERGQDVLPCECDFKIKNAGALCPACKEPYKSTEMGDLVGGPEGRAGSMLSLPPPPGGVPASRMERQLSIVRSHKAMTRSQTGEWDLNRWLFETKGTYGYGNAIWPKENEVDNGGAADGQPAEFTSKPWRPLTRNLKIPAAILSPYRLLVLIRMAVLGLFLTWRVKHKNEDAMWLWGMSVVCELWFGLSWVLD